MNIDAEYLGQLCELTKGKDLYLYRELPPIFTDDIDPSGERRVKRSAMKVLTIQIIGAKKKISGKVRLVPVKIVKVHDDDAHLTFQEGDTCEMRLVVDLCSHTLFLRSYDSGDFFPIL